MAVGLLLNVSDVKPECHFVVAVAEILPTDSLSSSVLVMDETSDQMSKRSGQELLAEGDETEVT